MKIWRKLMLFYLGGMAYTGMELLWRRRSHESMFVLGGLCFLLIGSLSEGKKPMPPVLRCVAGAGIITALELLCGLMVNRQYEIWDYRSMPMEFQGQICLPFSLLWIPVSLLADVLYRRINRHLFY